MKTRNPKATCETCPYWFEEKPDSRLGTCRKYMPSVPISQGSNSRRYGGRAITINGVFSEMFSDDWCGEHPDFLLDTAQQAREEAENALVDLKWQKMREEYGFQATHDVKTPKPRPTYEPMSDNALYAREHTFKYGVKNPGGYAWHMGAEVLQKLRDAQAEIRRLQKKGKGVT